jgi:hypothetical protein
MKNLIISALLICCFHGASVMADTKSNVVAENGEGWKVYRIGNLLWTSTASDYMSRDEAKKFCEGSSEELENLTAGLSLKTKFRLPTSEEAKKAFGQNLFLITPISTYRDGTIWTYKAATENTRDISGLTLNVYGTMFYEGKDLHHSVACVTEASI